MKLNRKNIQLQVHPFHIVDRSPWPFISAHAALFLTCGFASYLHAYPKGFPLMMLGLFLLLLTMYGWWSDVVKEATFLGKHTSHVQLGLRWGMLFFLVSEAMFFFAFFWAFFHSALNPHFSIGCVWPPKGIDTISPWGLPFLNTAILISSGFTVTWAHHAMVAGNKGQALEGLLITILLGVIFTFVQFYEYINAPFNISSGIYGSVFFMMTGFHGIHVIIGTIALFFSFLRLYFNHFTKEHHFGFEAAAWYWHFVDVVWILLYIFVYIWGS